MFVEGQIYGPTLASAAHLRDDLLCHYLIRTATRIRLKSLLEQSVWRHSLHMMQTVKD